MTCNLCNMLIEIDGLKTDWSKIRKARKAEDRVWSLGLGPTYCLHHHCPMTVYGGCPECNKELLKKMDLKFF